MQGLQANSQDPLVQRLLAITQKRERQQNAGKVHAKPLNVVAL